ncbi:hypothetical protein QE429_000857 [Bacillus sp. SORGH_AS 510]|uniref:DUF3231 family protein n=1 Tax=Bacillus sp. SORGH_AS_0510 TaxID=3041771 RepID=UPI00278ACCEE|nr:DUF3231 family protein [Bacillus sp. SORGH_AS_0510]MDQ1144030.1 hypothetical protein [Bacillus sp. SORGH_AS_0510]
MKDKNPISASEVGTLWVTYQEKTMILRILEYFLAKADDQEAKNIMGGLWQELHDYVLEIKKILQDEGVAIPVGITASDVNLEAPNLYDNGFDIMFLRVLKELSMGMYTINMNMSYRRDVMKIYSGLTRVTQRIYELSTLYLLEKGVLSLPPKVTMPKANEFVENKSYFSGLNFFNEKRVLNTVELGILHHGIETNNVGMQLITGFAQCAQDKEVKEYFIKGKELAKKQIKIFEGILLENDIQFSSTSGSTVTRSQVAPFSDKLMMLCIFFLNTFGMIGNTFGTMFTMRNDIIVKNGLIGKDVYFFARDGIKLMIKNGWLEEPPPMEDRETLIKG